MLIDEAIKILTSELPNAMPNNPPRRLDALKLGIEALKREKKFRLPQFKGHIKPLPGETKD